MAFRIYIDESGTHDERWLIIGMLFVPNHGILHSDLCSCKERHEYYNNSPKRKARYKETHLAAFRSSRDTRVATEWLDVFFRHACYYRAVVIDWSIWDGSYFGTPFEAEAMKKRRAYKKWAEMLLHPELKSPCLGSPIYHANLYLDRLLMMSGYDVLDHLRDRFTQNYEGHSPYIEQFQHTDSWRDANQCLQLCDLLTGCVYQALVPSNSVYKCGTRDHLLLRLKDHRIESLGPAFWRQYHPKTLTEHFPKFSLWYWRPTEESRKAKRRKRRRR